MDQHNAVSWLIQHFDEDGWPIDLNENKLRDRETSSEDTQKPGWFIVEIERHHRILGSSYTKGSAMSAYQTYWMRYSLNPDTNEVEVMSDKNGDIEVDAVSLANEAVSFEGFLFIIETLDDDKYKITESSSSICGEISGLKEAIDFGLGFVEGESIYFKEQLDLHKDSVPNEKINKLVSEYEEALKDAITESVESAWEDKEEADEIE